MSKNRTTALPALVIKSQATGEGDLLVTLLTQEQGKIVAVAKGTQKITSTRKAHLESGNLLTVFLVKTRGLPLLTQTKLIADTGRCRQDLKSLRRLFEFLEILNLVTVEEELPAAIFHQLLTIREMLIKQVAAGAIKKELTALLANLGISEEDSEQPGQAHYTKNGVSLSGLVSEFTGKRLLAFDYLRV